MNILLLVIGGALGAVGRYLIGLYMMKLYSNPPFPIAMIIVNVVGSFGLGFFLGGFYKIAPEPLYNMIGIGFFGSFTTFSTFSVEAVQLFNKKEWRKLSAYVFLSIAGSIVFFMIGMNTLSSIK